MVESIAVVIGIKRGPDDMKQTAKRNHVRCKWTSPASVSKQVSF